MICHSEGIFWKLELSRTDSSSDDSNPQLLYRATHPSVLDPGNRGVYLVIRSPTVQAIHSDSTRRPHAGPSPRIFIWSASGAERDRLAHATLRYSLCQCTRRGTCWRRPPHLGRTVLFLPPNRQHCFFCLLPPRALAGRAAARSAYVLKR